VTVAWGIFHDEMNLTGWDRLYVHSSFAYEDPKQVYAAGFVEGNNNYHGDRINIGGHNCLI
jgi:hypothetical protein